MIVTIAGSSGFLGTHLAEALRARSHVVRTLVRRPPARAEEATWDPAAGIVAPEVIAASDVIVNLAGSPTVGNPHSGRWASALRDSRVTGTRTLALAIAATSPESRPGYVVGNGIAWYGAHGTEPVTEATDSVGDAFMTRVCRDWQDAAQPLLAADGHVSFLRTAPVLHRTSAPLKQLVLAFRAGLGARLGSGDQYFPIMSLRDWVSGAVATIEDAAPQGARRLAGPVNMCSVTTPTNAEFTTALATALDRRARLSVPSWALSRGAGRLAPELLGSVRAMPAALLAADVPLRDHDATQVIAAALA